MVAIGILKSGYFLTDAAFIGHLSDDALTAKGGVAFAWWILLLLGELGGTGAHALVAQHIGANQRDRISHTTGQALWVAAFIALAVQVLHGLADDYFRLLGFAPGSAEFELGEDYLFASIIGAGAFAFHATLGGVFRGIGDTRTVMWITVVTVIVNAALDPVLIWGWGPLPALGIAGAAWATTAANLLGAVLAAFALGLHRIRLIPGAPDLARIRRILEIGAPVSARGIAFAGIYVILGRMITSFGTHEMAALGVGHRIESIPYLTSVGFEVGCATLVGQHIGARDRPGARRAIRAALALCMAAMVPCMLAVLIFAEPLFGLFANEPSTIAAGALYLRIQTAAFLCMSLESVYQGAFTGLGRTVPAFWIGAIGTSARIPIAWLLAFPLGLGVSGIWIAIATSTIAKGLVMAWWFERRTLPATPAEELAR